MYIAELKGKLPGNLEGSEDILTSNVFSFFKYSDRTIYLKRFFETLAIPSNDYDLEAAEFLFWPVYSDGTEPDIVIIAGEYYVLIEAKLGAGFGPEDEKHGAQLEREYLYGSAAAVEMGKKFILVALTADYTFPKKKLDMYSNIIYPENFKWINWQAVSRILTELLESEAVLPDRDFTMDLLGLLDKKRLRSFQSFSRLSYNRPPRDVLFFSANTADYRGDFIGFINVLAGLGGIESSGYRIFYGTDFFNSLKGCAKIDLQSVDSGLFYRGECKK